MSHYSAYVLSLLSQGNTFISTMNVYRTFVRDIMTKWGEDRLKSSNLGYSTTGQTDMHCRNNDQDTCTAQCTLRIRVNRAWLKKEDFFLLCVQKQLFLLSRKSGPDVKQIGQDNRIMPRSQCLQRAFPLFSSLLFHISTFLMESQIITLNPFPLTGEGWVGKYSKSMWSGEGGLQRCPDEETNNNHVPTTCHSTSIQLSLQASFGWLA